MLEDISVPTVKSSAKKRNNRKRTKVFDPCISNKKKKMSVEHCADENCKIYDQFSLIKQHLLSSNQTNLNKTMDVICNELGLNKYISEDDLSDDQDENFHAVPRNFDSVERCISKMFEGLDDYAAFNPKLVGSTPKVQRKAFSNIDLNFKTTPAIESTLKSPNRSITVYNHENFSITPSLGRKSCGSYTINESKNEFSRPLLMDKTNLIKTPDPLINCNVSSSKTSTPLISNIRDSICTPLRVTPRLSTKKSFSPGVIDVSPEVKRTLLVGVACYVDVKTNKEDCSSSVALELLSMGASVEKTFNKKVTHVVFKEGRPSTFLKAKKLNIIMISVLWLEACKRERTMVDPSLYPPINVEKYESLSPSGKKIPSLRTIQRKLRKHLLRDVAVSADNKSKIRINWRNALTDIKVHHINSQESSQGRHCTKKLDFDKTNDQNPIENISDNVQLTQDSVVIISDSHGENGGVNESKNTSGSYNNNQASSQMARRKSAPGRFIKDQRKRNDDSECATKSQNKFITIDKLFAKQKTLNEAIDIILLNENNKIESTQCSQNKKKKLFNPKEETVILDTPDDKGTPPPVVYEFPYKDDQEVSVGKKVRTRSTSMRKIFKKIIVNKKPVARKSLHSLLEVDEVSTSTRSSLSCFLDLKDNNKKLPKNPPTIVFTSILPEDVLKLSFITGKLGVFDIEDKVCSKTTHLVTSAPRRTINLMKALVRGAWILHVDWIYKSDIAGYWLNEEEFEIKTFSHAVTEMRRERQAFGTEFCSELFSTCGSIYISKKSVPPNADLVELVQLSKGQIVTNANLADYVIGGKYIEGETVVRVKEKWILDSITQNMLLDTGRYLIKPDKCKQISDGIE